MRSQPARCGGFSPRARGRYQRHHSRPEHEGDRVASRCHPGRAFRPLADRDGDPLPARPRSRSGHFATRCTTARRSAEPATSGRATSSTCWSTAPESMTRLAAIDPTASHAAGARSRSGERKRRGRSDAAAPPARRIDARNRDD
jgi:hypothetical protein